MTTAMTAMTAISSLMFFLGFYLGSIFQSWRSRSKVPKPPPPPRCRATLESGHQCIYGQGHEGYHKTQWDGDALSWRVDSFCWEDPKCGVYPAKVVWK